jgi:hypothetical protein
MKKLEMIQTMMIGHMELNQSMVLPGNEHK